MAISSVPGKAIPVSLFSELQTNQIRCKPSGSVLERGQAGEMTQTWNKNLSPQEKECLSLRLKQYAGIAPGVPIFSDGQKEILASIKKIGRGIYLEQCNILHLICCRLVWSLKYCSGDFSSR